ncbi:MAG: hypothetical protein GX896_10335 [Clostridiales bacterium]|nr:hypothetical protein [Clostridiales bacterium]
MSRSCLKCGTKVDNDTPACTSCGEPITQVEPQKKVGYNALYLLLGAIAILLILIFIIIIPIVTGGFDKIKELFQALNIN